MLDVSVGKCEHTDLIYVVSKYLYWMWMRSIILFGIFLCHLIFHRNNQIWKVQELKDFSRKDSPIAFCVFVGEGKYFCYFELVSCEWICQDIWVYVTSELVWTLTLPCLKPSCSRRSDILLALLECYGQR